MDSYEDETPLGHYLDGEYEEEEPQNEDPFFYETEGEDEDDEDVC